MSASLLPGSTIRLNVSLEVSLRQDGDQWLASCPSLDVVSQAPTMRRSLAALRQAIELWFESCLDRGVLDEALKEAGFHRRRRERTQATADSVVLVKKRGAPNRPAPRSVRRVIEVMVPAYTAAQTPRRATR